MFTKAYLCFPDIQQMIRRNSTTFYLLMSKLCSLLRLKLYSLNYAIAHVQKQTVTLIKICIKHKKTNLSLETSAEINFEIIKFIKKNVNCLPLTKQIGTMILNVW